MAGLVTYTSSDEEDEAQEQTLQETKSSDATQATQSTRTSNDNLASEIQSSGPASHPLLLQPDAHLIGPVLGPSTTELVPTDLLEGDDGLTPQSPYSANRTLLRNLTLPTIPNIDIPPSPPGSPVASTNAKFKHFLDLKQKGIHFNEKLANSSAMKNPSLMQKLLDFSDIDELGQYATTLPKDLWNPGSFPEYAYKEELAKSQQKIARAEEEKQLGPRGKVEFVPATISEPSSRSATPGLGGKGSQRSAAERVMAGLDRARSSYQQGAGTKRKTRFDS